VRRFLFIAVLAITACSGGGLPGFVNTPECQSIAERLPDEPLREIRVELRTGGVATLVDAEIADGEVTRSHGLMCRSEVPDGTGMLFEFGGATTGGFWMFNTHVPLDIIYFDRVGVVVGAAAMVPCPLDDGESERNWRDRCLEESLAYSADGAYARALELPGGWLLTQGLSLDALPDDLRLTVYGNVNS
jgi:hypothetical protein|tara:strand:- start:1239 stop:1805 length:567 start_codon:yes stop_codon:yes gene_type:complete